MRNTEAFYQKAKRYQDERKAIVSKYENEVNRLERFKGSQGYDEDLKQLKENNRATLDALQAEYRPEFLDIIGGMMDSLGKRTMKTPTTDQLNLLSVLRMKKKISYEELSRAAQTVKDNPLAIDIVNEIAREQNIFHDFSDLCEEMSSEAVEKILNRMRNETEDFLKYDTDYASRQAIKLHENLYGITGQEPKKAELFDTMEGCYQRFAGLNRKQLEMFQEIVD